MKLEELRSRVEAALLAGMSPASMVDDDPVEVVRGRTIWRPANYEGSYIGTITLTKALQPEEYRPTPELGQHTDEIMARLGRDAKTIADLRARGVI